MSLTLNACYSGEDPNKEKNAAKSEETAKAKDNKDSTPPEIDDEVEKIDNDQSDTDSTDTDSTLSKIDDAKNPSDKPVGNQIR